MKVGKAVQSYFFFLRGKKFGLRRKKLGIKNLQGVGWEDGQRGGRANEKPHGYLELFNSFLMNF